MLDRGADVLPRDLRDASALTSAVLHATDTGLATPLLGRDGAAVVADAEALVGAALAAGRLDLAAALLWTWPMLGLPLSAGARYAVEELVREKQAAG